MRRFAIVLFTLLPFSAMAAGEEGSFPGVRGLMSEQEFRAAGMEKLSPAEREALDQWLIRYTAWQAPQLRKDSDAVKAVEREDGLTAHVKPPFKGWSGKTRFYLDNGDVWQQRLSGRFYYRGEATAVKIRRNALGFFELEHTASGRSVGVRKVK